MKCIYCNTDLTDILHYKFKSSQGNLITVCDCCYQDIGNLSKIDGKWKEYVIYNGENYYMLKN